MAYAGAAVVATPDYFPVGPVDGLQGADDEGADGAFVGAGREAGDTVARELGDEEGDAVF